MQFLMVAQLLVWLSLFQVSNLDVTKPKLNTGNALVDTASRYIGVVEKTNHNDGYWVEKFLVSVGLPPKSQLAWCAAYASYCMIKSNIKFPGLRSGSVVAYKQYNKTKALDVFYGATIPKGSLVIFDPSHVEILVEDGKGSKLKTIGGNTSSSEKGNQREGEGVYLKNRTIVPYGQFRIAWFVKTY